MSSSAPAALQQEPPGEPSQDEPERARQRALFSAAGLETLYRQHASRLIRRFAGRLGGVDASDVVHDAFAKLAGARVGARGAVECPEALVTTVATNVLRDRARAAARQAAHQYQLAADATAELTDPHRLIESREALRAIERALAAMSPRRRRIFMLHRFEQMSYAEIGREVGMSEKGIKKQMAKALLELRRAAGPL